MYRAVSYILLMLSISITSMAQSQGEKEKVKQAFKNYKQAILNDEGSKAVSYTDSKTLKYYNTALHKIKHADSLDLINMKRLDRFTVLAIRYRANKDEIMKFNGRSLFEYAINAGMVGKGSVMNNTIGDVEINGNTAKGRLLVNEAVTPFQLHFNKESGRWKVDITSIFPVAENAFDKMIKNSSMDENMYLMMILSMMSNEAPKNEVWKAVAG